MRILSLLVLLAYSALPGYCQTVFQNKLAILVENTRFDHSDWNNKDFNQLVNSANGIKSLLRNQGFAEENILICRNLSAKQYRDTIQYFIKRIARLRKTHKDPVAVQYLLSHGTTLPDNSGDEQVQDPARQDKVDEVFVCKDTPNQADLVKNHQFDKSKNKDYHENAIVDDELGEINEQIISAIGSPEGHYLLLSDFCNSERSSKGSVGGELPNLLSDGCVFFDIFGTSSVPKTPAFLMLAISNSSVRVSPHYSKMSYFVRALTKAFSEFRVFQPTYREIHTDFTTALMHIDAQEKINNRPSIFPKNSGVPDIYEHTSGDADKWVFNNSFIASIKNFFIKKQTGQKAAENNAMRLTFTSDSISLPPYSYIQITEGSQNHVVSTGLLEAVSENQLKVMVSNPARLEADRSYKIGPNKAPSEKAYAALQRAKSKMELRQVLKELHSPLLDVKTHIGINAYRKDAESVLYFFKDSTSFEKINYEVDTTDNITIAVSLPRKDLYYTILDVTPSQGIRPDYLPVSFNNEHTHIIKTSPSTQKNEINHFRSRFTKPFGHSYLWVIVIDAPMDEQYLKKYLFDNERPVNQIKGDTHRRALWAILKHVRYFQEISYRVLPNRKR